VFHAADVAELEPVRLGQTGKTVATVEELVAHPRAQRRLMRDEIRDAADTEFSGALFRHRQRVAVGKAERLHPDHPEPATEIGGDAGVDLQRIADRVGTAELHGPSGPGVLRVEVDLAAAQRFEGNLGAAESEAALDT